MRRRATMVIALVLPLGAYSWAAGAQPKPNADAGATATPSGSGVGATGTAAASGSPNAASAVSAAPNTSAPPTTPPTPSTTVDMSAKASDQPMNGGTYTVRLRDLEQRVDDLKDQIRRSHTRLALLSDTILGGGASGSRSEIDFRNEMSSAFQLTKALVVLDGQLQYNRQDDSGALADQKEIPIYTGSVPPGDHTIQVSLTFQGNGFGVFSYLRGYKFQVKSSHSFTAIEGKALTITATAYEKGGVTTPLDQRPDVEWQEKIQPFKASAAEGSSANGGSPVGGGPK
jgi:hypothetical protein